MQAESHFVLRDPRGDLRIRIALESQSVEGRYTVDHALLAVSVNPARVGEKMDRFGSGAKLHALVDAGQESVSPSAVARRVGTGIQNDESRQAVAERAQPVRDPRAESWPSESSESGMEEEFAGTMVELVGLHRTDDGQVICSLGQVRQEVGEPRAGLTVLREFVRGRQRSRALGNKGELLALQDAVGHWLAFKLREGRLGVEQIDLGRTAKHVQEDDMLGPRGEVRHGGFGCTAIRREKGL